MYILVMLQYREYDYFIFQRGIEIINWNKYVFHYIYVMNYFYEIRVENTRIYIHVIIISEKLIFM